MTEEEVKEKKEKIYAEVIDYYNQGYSQTDIAKMLGLFKSTISSYILFQN